MNNNIIDKELELKAKIAKSSKELKQLKENLKHLTLEESWDEIVKNYKNKYFILENSSYRLSVILVSNITKRNSLQVKGNVLSIDKVDRHPNIRYDAFVWVLNINLKTTLSAMKTRLAEILNREISYEKGVALFKDVKEYIDRNKSELDKFIKNIEL